MTDLEQYIKEHKIRMDMGHINPAIWSGIEKNMPVPDTKKKKYFILKLASAAAILLFALVVFLQTDRRDVEIPENLLAAYGFSSSNVHEVFQKKISLIEKTAFPRSYKPDLQNLLSQVKYLDQTYHSEVVYLEKYDYEEKIATQVLKYYKAKNDLLDKIIEVLEKLNKDENIYTEKNSRIYINL